MAVKARSRKKQNILNLINDSKKIACRHCVLCGNCNTQKQKEKSEEMGIITYCSLTQSFFAIFLYVSQLFFLLYNNSNNSSYNLTFSKYTL